LISLDVLRKTIQRDGFKGLYRGYGAHIMAFAPGSAVQWGTYEWTKYKLHQLFPGEKIDNAAICASAGSVAALCSAIVINPFDVVRIHRQLLNNSNRKEAELLSLNYIKLGRLVIKESGWRGTFSKFII
jgi:hypothetical protein